VHQSPSGKNGWWFQCYRGIEYLFALLWPQRTGFE
jgi:hypothetical protein